MQSTTDGNVKDLKKVLLEKLEIEQSNRAVIAADLNQEMALSRKTSSEYLEKLAELEISQGDFSSSANYYEQASEFADENDNSLRLKYNSVDQFQKAGRQQGNDKHLYSALRIIDDIEKKIELLPLDKLEEHNIFFIGVKANTFFMLYNVKSDHSLLNKSEVLLRETAAQCMMSKPSISCQFALQVYAGIILNLSDGGFYSGRLVKSNNLKEALVLLKDAIRHANGSGSKELITTAELQNDKFLYTYACFLNDEITQKNIEEKYRKMFDETDWSSKFNDELFDAIMFFTSTSVKSWSLESLIKIGKIKEQQIENSLKNTLYHKASLFELGEFYREVWQKTGDIRFLEDAFRLAEESMLYDYPNQMLPEKQKKFAFILSDYGREMHSIALLKRSVITFKAAADNYLYENRLFDSSDALNELNRALLRMTDLESTECRMDLSKQIIVDVDNLNKLRTFKLNESSPDQGDIPSYMYSRTIIGDDSELGFENYSDNISPDGMMILKETDYTKYIVSNRNRTNQIFIMCFQNKEGLIGAELIADRISS
jgi:hypothetical protein